MNVINKTIATLIGAMGMKSCNDERINWEQRRYELAKGALQGLCANPTYSNTSWDACAAEAIGYADKLINQLKE